MAALATNGRARRLTGGRVREFAAQLLSRGPLAGDQPLPAKSPLQGTLGPKRQAWQREAYGYFDTVNAAHYAHTFIGNASAKVVLEPAQLSPTDLSQMIDIGGDDNDYALDQDTQSKCRAIVDRLGEQGEINRLGNMNMSIAGEALVIFQAATSTAPEQIRATSLLEVRQQGSSIVLTDGTEITPDDDVLRVWQAHPKMGALADTWTQSVSDDFLELVLLNRQIRSQVTSRLATAGILALPNNLTFGGTTGSKDQNMLVDAMYEGMLRAIQRPGEASGVVPFILQGDADTLDKIKWITMDRTLDATSAAQREEKLRAIALGVDLPPEVLTGKADLNHWTGAIVDDNTNTSHIVPRAKTWADGLTQGFYRPALLGMGVPAAVVQRMVLRPNFSALVVRPNRAQDAKDAWDRFAISDEALLRYLGFSPDDAPEPEELAQRVMGRLRAQADPPIVEALMRMLLPGLNVVRPEPAGTIEVTSTETGEPDDTDDIGTAETDGAGSDPSTAPDAVNSPTGGDLPSLPASGALTAAAGLTSARLGQRLVDLDRQLRTRTITAADSALKQGLKRAGNKLRSRANGNALARATIDSVPRHKVAATLGRRGVAALGVTDNELLDFDWDELLDQFDDWAADAQEQALSLVAQWLGTTVDDTRFTSAVEQLADSRTAAAQKLRDALTQLAETQLYDPGLDGDDDGETDTSVSVPTGIVRQVVAIAGGSPDGLADPVDGIPVGGIGTGSIVYSLLTDAGCSVETYLWSWGGSPKPFPPHEDLDGVEFADWSDPVLTNQDGWPASLCQPGDHTGCSCDGVPQYSPYAPAGRAAGEVDGGGDDLGLAAGA